VRVTTQLLDGSGKKLHIINRLYNEAGALVATGEHLLLHVSLETRRACLPTPALQRNLAMIQAAQASLPRPETIHCGRRDSAG
jgi:carnitine 3-dehydrogenase